jgi:hypothetical protein
MGIGAMVVEARSSSVRHVAIIHQGIPETSISIDTEGVEHAIRRKLDLLS